MAVNVKELIADALRKEEEARDFYLKLREKAEDPGARELLAELAAEEGRHASALKGEDVAEFLKSEPQVMDDLRITEFLAPRKLSPSSSFQDTLIHAMKREDASFWAYQALAESADDKDTRSLFRHLAEQERLHRNRLERLYDDVIFAED